MYKTNLSQVETERSGVEGIWRRTKKLSIEEKAELVELLLGKESGMIVISANSHLADYIIAQMSLLSLDGLTHVLKEISTQMASETM
ncbi:hypothetical protein [Lyngbya aestuarii]|uniref:hypothetical protein n=1 Tax=Lyngbya aestuarii TaxID=118322 RepID=UPI00403D7E3F